MQLHGPRSVRRRAALMCGSSFTGLVGPLLLVAQACCCFSQSKAARGVSLPSPFLRHFSPRGSFRFLAQGWLLLPVSWVVAHVLGLLFSFGCVRRALGRKALRAWAPVAMVTQRRTLPSKVFLPPLPVWIQDKSLLLANFSSLCSPTSCMSHFVPFSPPQTSGLSRRRLGWRGGASGFVVELDEAIAASDSVTLWIGPGSLGQGKIHSLLEGQETFCQLSCISHGLRLGTQVLEACVGVSET